MTIKEWIIKRLEEDVEPNAGHINLEEKSEEERKKLFEEFGEGDDNLTEFLEIAYDCGAPSLFCCSGHGVKPPYVVLKVTEDNIELLQKVGKVLSTHGVATNFRDDYQRGLQVSYHRHGSDDPSTEWLSVATQVLERPEFFENIEPEILYHEKIYPSNKPFLYNLKKKMLNFLREDKKSLPSGSISVVKTNAGDKKPWDVTQNVKEDVIEVGKAADEGKETLKVAGMQKNIGVEEATEMQENDR